MKAIPGDISSGGFTWLSVRYIDRLRFPRNEPLDLSEYFLTAPQPTNSTPRILAGFQSTTQWFDEQTRTTALLTMASMVEHEHPALLYDLNVIRTSPEGSAIAESEWEEIVDELHVRQRDIFEESITDKTRELFR